MARPPGQGYERAEHQRVGGGWPPFRDVPTGEGPEHPPEDEPHHDHREPHADPDRVAPGHGHDQREERQVSQEGGREPRSERRTQHHR